MPAFLLRFSLIALFAASTAGAQRDTSFTWSRRIPDGGRLTIRSLNGPIDVRPSTSDRVEVHAIVRTERGGDAADMTFDVHEISADDIEICTVYRGRSICDRDRDYSFNDVRASARFLVEIPKSLRFRAFTGNGDVSVQQTVGDVEVRSGNGDLTVKESLGQVTLSTGNGDISLTSARGPVKASTGNGRIDVTATRGPVDATTGNGNVDVKMSTVPADVGSMTFSTGSGSVRVSLPADFNGELDASTGNGSVDSDFDIKVSGRINTSRLRGTIGNGNGPLVKLRSGNGRLVIRKS